MAVWLINVDIEVDAVLAFLYAVSAPVIGQDVVSASALGCL